MSIRTPALLALGASAAALLAVAAMPTAGTAAVPARFPAPPAEKVAPRGDQVAVLAGGCFWGMEGVFDHVKGVKSVTAGYAGGTKADANYAAVSSERTNHAEAVRVVYDPAQVSYGTLLKIYFSVAHDPTQLNRQFPDSGTSYRSAIFPQTPEQRQVAAAYIGTLNKGNVFGKPVVTKVENGNFFPAEPYHQDFMRKNPDNGYTNRYDKPKIAALKTSYPSLYKAG
ncbi:methionine sulfoxide reductase A [Novosphingobium sp. Rr 2-17]|uniref:peptide-methionine (S)-S-oxide reductase MsrA n=1 Tax=Novosphingobium sp. Rr 2-17 TaxID=555793 RepID=UPI000269A7BD|nr:peptide-methionine (S)-S-oxide reductase MsrA [Novosphingobium sp. Rr 2-17]EIZ80663.1 methionine sulfoxide reductase A [Novosphingobium sp. Rr 2-17]